MKRVSDELKAALDSGGERRTVERLEVIKEVFYQMTRAYLVGRIGGRGWTLPFVVALRNQESGVLVDAIMLDESDGERALQLHAAPTSTSTSRTSARS